MKALPFVVLVSAFGSLLGTFPIAADDYGLTVTIIESSPGCSVPDGGGMRIENTNGGAWLELEWYGATTSRNPVFRNHWPAGQGNPPADFFSECPQPEICDGECKSSTCPQNNEDLCTDMVCDDCACEIPRSSLVDEEARLFEPGDAWPVDGPHSCGLPDCGIELTAQACDEEPFRFLDCDNDDCSDGVKFCVALEELHVNIVSVSFDGECFLTSAAPELPVSVAPGEFVVNNACD